MNEVKRLIPIIAIVLISSCEKNPGELYDKESGQEEVLNRDQIDKVVDSFEEIVYSDINDQYKFYTDPKQKFNQALNAKRYRIVKNDDMYRYVVGNYRVMNFLSKDQYLENTVDDPEGNHKQYWLVDKEMLYMILDIILKLDEMGYNKYGFLVRDGHRHPRINQLMGGASLSQHVHGTAADLVAKDINGDGEENQKDKEILLTVAESVVGTKGGVGKYPGTMTVHIDCRGYAARWDSH